MWLGRGSWNEPPTLRSRRLVKAYRGVTDRFSIAGPPSGKFAVQYTPAHQFIARDVLIYRRADGREISLEEFPWHKR